VIAIKPDFVDARINLSQALFEQGNLSEAAASARRALAIRPTCLQASIQLAAALADQGQAGDAAASRFVYIPSPPPRTSISATRERPRPSRRSRRRLRESRRAQAELARAHKNLGDARIARGQRDAAIECYRKALAIEPDYAEAHNNLGGGVGSVASGGARAWRLRRDATLRASPGRWRPPTTVVAPLAFRSEARRFRHCRSGRRVEPMRFLRSAPSRARTNEPF
jgi:tetratricopeptide (TPR) repeat protein